VELHPYNQQPKLLRYCQEEGIAVTGFSPLGAGSYIELNMATADDSALTNPEINELATVKGVSPAQLILRWALQRGISIVPKSTQEARLKQNLDLDGFELSGEEMATMAVLDQGRRYNDPGVFCLGMGAFCPIYD
jgi:diketogulonate reductase-like aldo/keto reductase